MIFRKYQSAFCFTIDDKKSIDSSSKALPSIYLRDEKRNSSVFHWHQLAMEPHNWYHAQDLAIHNGPRKYPYLSFTTLYRSATKFSDFTIPICSETDAFYFIHPARWSKELPAMKGQVTVPSNNKIKYTLILFNDFLYTANVVFTDYIIITDRGYSSNQTRKFTNSWGLPVRPEDWSCTFFH